MSLAFLKNLHNALYFWNILEYFTEEEKKGRAILHAVFKMRLWVLVEMKFPVVNRAAESLKTEKPRHDPAKLF